jgi:ABC-type glycerol-3-phosphate transport system substrate-binding protein
MKKYLLLSLALLIPLSVLAAGCGGSSPPAGQAAQTSKLPEPQPQDNTIKGNNTTKKTFTDAETSAKEWEKKHGRSISDNGYKPETLKGKGLGRN